VSRHEVTAPTIACPPWYTWNVFDYHALLFGGFLGIGDDHYPMPWQSLKYNTSLGGYRTNLTADRLKGEA
jgi:hypothetical protein